MFQHQIPFGDLRVYPIVPLYIKRILLARTMYCSTLLMTTQMIMITKVGTIRAQINGKITLTCFLNHAILSPSHCCTPCHKACQVLLFGYLSHHFITQVHNSHIRYSHYMYRSWNNITMLWFSVVVSRYVTVYARLSLTCIQDYSCKYSCQLSG